MSLHQGGLRWHLHSHHATSCRPPGMWMGCCLPFPWLRARLCCLHPPTEQRGIPSKAPCPRLGCQLGQQPEV